MAVPLIEITQKSLHPTIEVLSNAGVTTEHAEWMRKPGNAALLAAFVAERMQTERTRARNGASYDVSVQVIPRQPRYSDLLKRFPAVDPSFSDMKFEATRHHRNVKRKAVFEYVRMESGATTDAVFQEMRHLGLRPAFYEELLSFADVYREEVRTHRIVALGSVAVEFDKEYVAYLCWVPRRGYCLRLDKYANIWTGEFVFLAVREAA
ncbi:MAG: hypothetical protein V1745_02215 [Patescibacteria group bacterium]